MDSLPSPPPGDYDSPTPEDGDMSANILLIEYEPRYVERVQQALSGSGYALEVAGDIDAAVEVCAAFEPQVQP